VHEDFISCVAGGSQYMQYGFTSGRLGYGALRHPQQPARVGAEDFIFHQKPVREGWAYSGCIENIIPAKAGMTGKGHRDMFGLRPKKGSNVSFASKA
jgi:hypothetical protein